MVASCCCMFRVGRVLPLPSDSWLDGSEAWWCHGAGGCHSARSSSKPPTVSTLSAQPRDCLVGESCIVVELGSLVENSCHLGAGNKVQCSRCHYELGRPISPGIVIFCGHNEMVDHGRLHRRFVGHCPSDLGHPVPLQFSSWKRASDVQVLLCPSAEAKSIY